MAQLPSDSLSFQLGWPSHLLNSSQTTRIKWCCHRNYGLCLYSYIYYIFVKNYCPEQSTMCIALMEMCHSTVRSTSKPRLWELAQEQCGPAPTAGWKAEDTVQAVVLCQGTSILRHVLDFDWIPVNQHVWNSLEGQSTTSFLDACLAWDSYYL